MPKDSYKSEFEIHAEAAEAQAEPQETTGLLTEAHAAFHPAASGAFAAGAVENEIIEAYGSGRRASVFAVPKKRRSSYNEAVEHSPRFKNPVTGAMQGKKSLEQIKSPYWMYILRDC
jgi:hypothetical protein